VSLSESGGELEQCFGHSTGDVDEHQIGDGAVGATQPAGQ